MKNDFIKYANSFQAVSRLGLESPTQLLELLGNPHKDLKFIHVAGTNGKGSVCCFLQSILTKAGYKTGKFTSPDMLSVHERISIDNVPISDEDMNIIMEKVQIAAEKTKEILGTIPTQFEIWTAAAFCYFKEHSCDFVVLEVGLGGRLDATNVIDSPVVSVITRIDIDHINYLGDTIEQITKEKCGIIKENSRVVTIPQDEKITNIIQGFCSEKNSPLTISKIPESHPYKHQESFDYDDIKDITLSLSGINQVENASLAIETAILIGIDSEYIKQGLSTTKHMGRFEIISESPYTVYDGAHNENGFKSLISNLERYFDTKEITFICAFMKDKDISNIFSLLKPYKDNCKIITTTVLNNERAESAEELCKKFNSNGFVANHSENVKAAYEIAKKDSNLIVICGSLYLYKDLMS